MPTAFVELVGEIFLNQRAEAASRPTAHRPERDEALQALAALGDSPHPFHRQVDDFASQAVVAARVVAGGVFLSRHQRGRIKKRAVTAGADLVNGNRLQVDEYHTWDALEALCGVAEAAAEECVGVVVEVVVLAHCSVRKDAVLQCKQLPTGACDLSQKRTTRARCTINKFVGKQRESRMSKANSMGR